MCIKLFTLLFLDLQNEEFLVHQLIYDYFEAMISLLRSERFICCLSNDKISIIDIQNDATKIQTDENVVEKGKKAESQHNIKWNAIHILSILAINSLLLSPQMLIPRHNSICYPEYRFELIIICAGVCLSVCLESMLQCVGFTKEVSILKLSVFLKMYLCLMLPIACLVCLSYHFWTSMLGFHHPMPLLGITVYFFGWCFNLTLEFSVSP